MPLQLAQEYRDELGIQSQRESEKEQWHDAIAKQRREEVRRRRRSQKQRDGERVELHIAVSLLTTIFTVPYPAPVS